MSKTTENKMLLVWALGMGPDPPPLSFFLSFSASSQITCADKTTAGLGFSQTHRLSHCGLVYTHIKLDHTLILHDNNNIHPRQTHSISHISEQEPRIYWNQVQPPRVFTHSSLILDFIDPTAMEFNCQSSNRIKSKKKCACIQVVQKNIITIIIIIVIVFPLRFLQSFAGSQRLKVKIKFSQVH